MIVQDQGSTCLEPLQGLREHSSREEEQEGRQKRRLTDDLGLRLSPSAGLGQVGKGFVGTGLSLLPLGRWKVKS